MWFSRRRCTLGVVVADVNRRWKHSNAAKAGTFVAAVCAFV